MQKIKLFMLKSRKTVVFGVLALFLVLSVAGPANADDDRDYYPNHDEKAKDLQKDDNWTGIDLDTIKGIIVLCEAEGNAEDPNKAEPQVDRCLERELNNDVGILPGGSSFEKPGVTDILDRTLYEINSSFYKLYLTTGLNYSSEQAEQALKDRESGSIPDDTGNTKCEENDPDKRGDCLVEHYKGVFGIDQGEIVNTDQVLDTQNVYNMAAVALLVLGIMWQGVRLIVMQRSQSLAVIIRGLVIVAISYPLGAVLGVIAANALDAYAGIILSNTFNDAESVLILESALWKVIVTNGSLSIFAPILMIILIVSSAFIRIMVLLQEVAAVFMIGLVPFAAAGQFTKTTKPWLMRIIKAILAIFAYKAALATGLSLIVILLLNQDADPTMRFIGFIALALLPFSLPMAMRVFAFAGVGGDGENAVGNLTNDIARVGVMAGLTDDEGTYKYKLAHGQTAGPHPSAPGRFGRFVSGIGQGQTATSAVGALIGRESTMGPEGRMLRSAQGSHSRNRYGPASPNPIDGLAGGTGTAGGGGHGGSGTFEWTPGDPRAGRFVTRGGLTPMGFYAATESFSQGGRAIGKSLSGESAMLDGYDELDWNNPDGIFDAT